MLGKALTTAAAGSAAGAAAGLGIEDVFSTWLFTGNGSGAQTITNGIDLSGEGGMVWTKARNRSDIYGYHMVHDTERGGGTTRKQLYTNTTDAEGANSLGTINFYSDGFSGDSFMNLNTEDYASWTFRKAPGFFDVVTYTGNGTAGRTVSHNLGGVPGAIIIKQTSSTGNNWCVYHRSLGTSKKLSLNTTDAAETRTDRVTAVSSSTFTLGNSSEVNFNGSTYVAYLFAHDEAIFGENADQSVIKCGTYAGTGTTGTDTQFINLGWEPQWVLIKNIDSGTSNWILEDNMRGFNYSNRKWLYPNLSDAETNFTNITAVPSSTGFTIIGDNIQTGQSGYDYIYIAIRRGPMKTPTDATEVFNVVTTTSPTASWTTGFPVDTLFTSNLTSPYIGTRLLGKRKYIRTSSPSAESDDNTDYFGFDDPTGTMSQTFYQGSGTYLRYSFGRASGFFDVVAYTGTGSARTINHNLGVAPELMLFKLRSTSKDWVVYSGALGAGTGLSLNYNDGQNSNYGVWNSTAPTATVFSIGSQSEVNSLGNTYISYHFATLDGISKVGSYTGTAATLNVDCGFSAGARFVLIKRTDASGDWYVWDTARGIVSGNDPYLLLNDGSTQVTSTDYIDPYSAGFTVTSSAPAALNASGGSYIFLSVA